MSDRIPLCLINKRPLAQNRVLGTEVLCLFRGILRAGGEISWVVFRPSFRQAELDIIIISLTERGGREWVGCVKNMQSFYLQGYFKSRADRCLSGVG